RSMLTPVLVVLMSTVPPTIAASLNMDDVNPVPLKNVSIFELTVTDDPDRETTPIAPAAPPVLVLELLPAAPTLPPAPEAPIAAPPTPNVPDVKPPPGLPVPGKGLVPFVPVPPPPPKEPPPPAMLLSCCVPPPPPPPAART